MITLLKNMIPGLAKIIYISDGSAAQYKNKYNFCNLVKHKEDFGLDAEWNFTGNILLFSSHTY